MTLPKILTVSDYYLPGYLGGGPIRTLANLRSSLTGQVDLAVFTRDRDLKAPHSYPDIRTNQWSMAADGPVFYADPDHFTAQGLMQALNCSEQDGSSVNALYLNSFFSKNGSVLPYFHLRKKAPHLPILLAPRGEFSPGALAIKAPKKKTYLALCRLMGLYKDVYWHASTAQEQADILRQFPKAQDRIFVAADPILIEPMPQAAAKADGSLRIAFISRLSPMKNLDGLLRILAGVKAKVLLNIYGPQEDAAYWAGCQKLMAALPANIQVHYKGPLAPEAVSATFAAHDLFAFPSHGENFGHVIFEALRAGTPVLLSDQTPWKTQASGALTTVPLHDVAGWRAHLERAAARTAAQQQDLRQATYAYACDYAASDQTRQANLDMFTVLAALNNQRKDTHVRR